MEDFKNMFVNAAEIQKPVLGRVVGTIPDWIQGSFLRTGPGRFDLCGDFSVNSWYDGYAILSKFHVSSRQQQVTYSSRYLQSDAYRKAMSSSRPHYMEFATRAQPDKKRIFQFLSSLDPSEVTDNCVANVFSLGRDVFSASETCYIRRVDPITLETREKHDYYKVAGANLVSPHLVLDDKTGNAYALGVSILKGSYVIMEVPAKPGGLKGLGCARVLATIKTSWASRFSYQHSLGFTEHYLVVVEQPLLVNSLQLLASNLKGRCFKDCMEWTPEEKNRFYVISKKTGKVVGSRAFSDRPFFFFHFVNCFEAEDKVVVDIVAYPNPSVIDDFSLKTLRTVRHTGYTPCSVLRFRLPLPPSASAPPISGRRGSATASLVAAAATCVPEDLGCDGMEFPVVNAAQRGKPYRFVYGSGVYDRRNLPNSLVKVDLLTGARWLWKDSDHAYPGEPVFLPAPGARTEDDGVLLSAVTDSRVGMPGFLVFLDAGTLRELCRAVVPVQVPQAVHGTFLQEERTGEKDGVRR